LDVAGDVQIAAHAFAFDHGLHHANIIQGDGCHAADGTGEA
jgi:hypothetical protein